MDDTRKAIRLTKRTVDAALPEAKLYRAWDSDLKGFGLRVMPGGTKTYFVMYRPDGGGRSVNAKEYTIGKHGTLTPDEARREAEKLLSGVRLGDDPQAAKQKARAELTVADLCDLYLKEGVGMKKPSTLATDRFRIERHIKPLLGDKRITKVTDTDIVRFMSDVAKGKTAVAAKLSKPQAAAKGLTGIETRKRTDPIATGGKGTASRTVGLLGAIFTFAMKPGRKLVTANPVRGVERYKDKTSERYLTADELGRLGAAMAAHGSNKYALAVIRLLTLTGARKSEIEGLRWDEVNFDLSCLCLGDSKTGQKVIPLGAPAMLILQGLERVAGSEYVFPARDHGADKAVRRHYVGTPNVWAEIRKAAALPGVRIHDLRHTFASLAAGGGQGLLMIGKILGHADVKTTARYAHLADDPVKAAVNRVSEAAAAALAGKSGQVIPMRATKPKGSHRPA